MGKNPIDERELSYLSFCAKVIVGTRGKMGYSRLRRLLTEVPPGVPKPEYPFRKPADAVLKQLHEVFLKTEDRDEKARGPWGLASYLVNWAEQQ